MTIKRCTNTACEHYNKLIISSAMCYCSKCGTELTATTDFFKCSSCNKFAHPTDKYCPYCGTVLGELVTKEMRDFMWYQMLHSVVYLEDTKQDIA